MSWRCRAGFAALLVSAALIVSLARPSDAAAPPSIELPHRFPTARPLSTSPQQQQLPPGAPLGYWNFNLQPMLVGQSSFTPVALGDYIYLPGGLYIDDDGDYDWSPLLQRFSPHQNSWRLLSSFPGPTIAEAVMSPAPSGLGLYVFNFDAIYYYNIALNFWKELSWFNHSTVVGGSAITLGDSVYLVGGATNNASQQQNFDSFVAFEPTSGRFTSLPPLPVGRLSPFLCSDGSRIFVLGGITRNYTNYQHLNTFDLTTSTWTTSRTSPISWPPFEDGLAIQAAVYHGGLVYAFFGGDLVQSYNPNSDSWAIVQSQTPQKDIGILFGAVTFASQIFFFGGFSALDAVMLSTAGTFVPPP